MAKTYLSPPRVPLKLLDGHFGHRLEVRHQYDHVRLKVGGSYLWCKNCKKMLLCFDEGTKAIHTEDIGGDDDTE